MVRVQYVVPQTDRLEYVESFDSLGEAVAWIRDLWNEEEGGEQTFFVSDEATGRLLATMTRPDPSDPELCLTLCFEPGGALVLTALHRCKYVFDDLGHLLTEVTRVDHPGNMIPAEQAP